MSSLRPDRPHVNGDIANMAQQFLTTLNQLRAEQAGPVRLGPAPAPPSLAAVVEPDTAAAHRRGVAAATSTLIACLHDVDGSWLERGLAYDVVRQVVLTYLDQIDRSQQQTGGTR